MNINQIQHFLALKKCEHMPSAADFLNMSQPALSRSISSLEEELGVKLFDRVGRRVRLNENGRMYAEYAEKVVALLEQASFAVKAFRYEMVGSLKIHCFAFAPIIMRCVNAYSELNPYVSYHIHQPSEVMEEIPDFYLSSSEKLAGTTDEENNEWSALPLLKEHFVLVTSLKVRKENWPECGEEIDLSLLKDEFFRLMSMSNEFFRDKVFEFCSEYGFVPKIRVISDDFFVGISAVEEGTCCTFIPESCLPYARKIAPGLLYYRLKEGLGERTVYLLHPRESKMTETAKDFLEFAKDYYNAR